MKKRSVKKNKLFEDIDFLDSYIKNSSHKNDVLKLASSVVTKELSKYSLELENYKEQIKELLLDRYQKELNFIPGDGSLDADYVIEEMLPEKIIISINSETDEVLSVSGFNTGYGANRMKVFAGKPTSLANARMMKSAMFQQLEESFKKPQTFSEMSYDLFEKFEKLYNYYIKVNEGRKPFDLYYLPAESAAMLIPGRNMKVKENGVVYEKMVHGASTIADKITISNSPNINGAIGYPTFEEASAAAKYKNKFIRGARGWIKEMEFNPMFWGAANMFKPASFQNKMTYKISQRKIADFSDLEQSIQNSYNSKINKMSQVINVFYKAVEEMNNL